MAVDSPQSLLWTEIIDRPVTKPSPPKLESPVEDKHEPRNTRGVVLWSRSFTPAAATLAQSTASPVNNLIREALIEGRSNDDRYEKDGYTVRWTLANDLELIFVVAYQRILQLTYVDDLLAAIKELFTQLYHPFLTTFVASLHASSSTLVVQTSSSHSSNNKSNNSNSNSHLWDFTTAFKGWDKVFDKLLRDVEQKANKERRGRIRQISGTTTTPTSPSYHHHEDEAMERENASGETTPALDASSPLDGQEIAKNIAHVKTRLK
ncbi:hypothetical protein FRC17_003963, partial [Serendipita sp. 399]